LNPSVEDVPTPGQVEVDLPAEKVPIILNPSVEDVPTPGQVEVDLPAEKVPIILNPSVEDVPTPGQVEVDLPAEKVPIVLNPSVENTQVEIDQSTVQNTPHLGEVEANQPVEGVTNDAGTSATENTPFHDSVEVDLPAEKIPLTPSPAIGNTSTGIQVKQQIASENKKSIQVDPPEEVTPSNRVVPSETQVQSVKAEASKPKHSPSTPALHVIQAVDEDTSHVLVRSGSSPSISTSPPETASPRAETSEEGQTGDTKVEAVAEKWGSESAKAYFPALRQEEKHREETKLREAKRLVQKLHREKKERENLRKIREIERLKAESKMKQSEREQQEERRRREEELKTIKRKEKAKEIEEKHQERQEHLKKTLAHLKRKKKTLLLHERLECKFQETIAKEKFEYEQKLREIHARYHQPSLDEIKTHMKTYYDIVDPPGEVKTTTINVQRGLTQAIVLEQDTREREKFERERQQAKERMARRQEYGCTHIPKVKMSSTPRPLPIEEPPYAPHKPRKPVSRVSPPKDENGKRTRKIKASSPKEKQLSQAAAESASCAQDLESKLGKLRSLQVA